MLRHINFVELGNTLCEYDYVEVAKMICNASFTRNKYEYEGNHKEVAYNGSNICKSYDVYARQGDKIHLIVYTGLKECD